MSTETHATDDAETGTATDSDGQDDGLLVLDDLTKLFGGLTAVDNLSFAVEEGEIRGFIGPNGAGKSTLADAVSGHLPYEGSVSYRGRRSPTRGPATSSRKD